MLTNVLLSDVILGTLLICLTLVTAILHENDQIPVNCF